MALTLWGCMAVKLGSMGGFTSPQSFSICSITSQEAQIWPPWAPALQKRAVLQQHAVYASVTTQIDFCMLHAIGWAVEWASLVI